MSAEKEKPITKRTLAGRTIRALGRLARRLLVGAVLIVLIALGLLQIAPVSSVVGRFVLNLANPWPGTVSSVGSVGGSWFSSLTLTHVRITGPADSLFISIDTLQASYDLSALFSGTLQFRQVFLTRPIVRTRLLPDGALVFLQAFAPADTLSQDTSKGLSVRADHLQVTNGEFALIFLPDTGIQRIEVQEIELRADSIVIAGSVAARIDTVCSRALLRDRTATEFRFEAAGALYEDSIRVRSLSVVSARSRIEGSGVVPLPLSLASLLPGADVSLSAEPISYGDLHPLLPGFGPEGEARIHLMIAGRGDSSLSRLTLEFRGGGAITLHGRTSRMPGEGLALDVTGESRRFSPSSLGGIADTSESLEMRVSVVGRGTNLADFSGTVNLEILPSNIPGIGPLKGMLRADILQGEAHATLRATAPLVQVDAEADLTPFAPNPAYDLRGTFTVVRSDSPATPLQRLGGLAARVSISGQGFDPDSARAHAVVRGSWSGNPHFTSILFEGDYGRDTLHAAGHLVTASGAVHTTAEAVFAGTPEYRIRVPSFRGISLAAFGSGIPSSRLTGSLEAEASGTSLADWTGTVSLALDSSEIGDVSVRRLQTDVTIERGRLHVAGFVESNAGSVSLHGLAEPFAKSPFVTVERSSFRNVDLGRILGAGSLSSDLNGSVQFHAAARSTDDISLLTRGSLKDGEGALEASASVSLDDSRFNRQTIRAASIALTLLDGTLETSLAIQTPEGGLTGQADAHPFDEAPRLTVRSLTLDHLDIGALAGVDGLNTALTGRIEGGLEGESFESSTGELSVELDGSNVNAGDLRAGSLRATMDGGRFSVHGTADFPDGRATLEAAGQLVGGGVHGNLSLTASLRDSAARRDADTLFPSGLHLRTSLDGLWGSPAETNVRGTIHGNGSYRGFRIDTLLCNLSMQARTVDIDTVHIITNAGSITAGGTFALFDSTSAAHSDLSFSAFATSLQPLEKIFGWPQTLLRSATLSLHAAGPPDMTEVHCETNLDIAGVGDLAVMSMHGSVDVLLGPSATPEMVVGKAKVEGFHYGSLALESASVSVHSARNRHDFAGFVRLNTQSSVSLAGSVRDDSDSLMILIDSLVSHSPSGTWRLGQQASISYGRRLAVHDFALQSGTRDIVVRGVLDPAGDQDFTISGDSLDLATLGMLFGRTGLEGLLFVDVHVEGPAGDPRAVGDLSVSLRSGGEALGDLSAHMDWRAQSLALDGRIEQSGGGNVVATARLPVALPLVGNRAERSSQPPETARPGPFEAQMTAEKFNLGFLRPVLSPQTVSSLAGELTANIHARGSLDSIVADGVASVDSGQIGISQLGVVYSGIRFRCTAAGKDLAFEEAELSSGDGVLRLSGGVSLRDPRDPALNLKISAERFLAVQTPEMKATVSGELHLTGTVPAPTVSGHLLVNDSYFIVPETEKAGSVETVELTAEDYAMLQQYFGYRHQLATVETDSSTIDPTVDLTLEMHQNTWIRKRLNPTLAIELQGRVRIERRPNAPVRLNGTLKPVTGRSYVGQFGRQFEIRGGEIVFKGSPEESELRIESEYKVPSKTGSGLSEVVIRMRVESNFGRFLFSLTSDPAMDESEILSYLATGQSQTGALANTADQGGLAGAMALEQLVGAAGGITEGSVPVDVFQIRQDGARGITIVAGNYVNPKMYMGVRQPILFSQGTQDSYYDTRTQFELEYEAEPWLFLNMQGGSSRVLLFLKARHAY